MPFTLSDDQILRMKALVQDGEFKSPEELIEAMICYFEAKQKALADRAPIQNGINTNPDQAEDIHALKQEFFNFYG